MNGSQNGTAVIVIAGVEKDADGDATIIVTGELNNTGFLNEQTKHCCHRAALEYLGRVNPVKHFSKSEVVKTTTKCSVFIVVRSTERKDEFREKTVEQMEARLINVHSVPKENIIVLRGRRPQDVSDEILKRKLPQNIFVVVEKQPLFAKWNILTLSLRKNGLNIPQYVEPNSPTLLRRRTDRKPNSTLSKVGNSTS